MSNDVWDDPRLKGNDDYVRWENPGDKLEGEIVHLSVHSFEDGKSAPKLIVRDDDGNERTLTAGQVQLATKLSELRPKIGDHIVITYLKSEPRGGGKTLKHFDVTVASGAASSAKSVV